jgi:hypothetical protein
MAMLAFFEEQPLNDRRRTVRRSLHLGGGGSGEPVTIHDLSLTGALIETSIPMLVGAMFEIELPQTGKVAATVVWNSGEYYGCQFDLPIAPSVLSAALLQAAPRAAPNPNLSPDPINELKELNAEVERLAWKMENALNRLTRN